MDNPDHKVSSVSAGSKLRVVRVWDAPTRLFHWLLVILVAVSLYTGNVGGLAEMDWHMLSGYAILTLVAFRVVWGLIGSHHSRFRTFVRGPMAIGRYLVSFIRGPYRPTVGHNPLGGWSVVAMLAALLVQAVTGLFANDDILTEGPLASSVSEATSNTLTAVHELNALVLYGLIAVHIAAIAIYLVVKKQNLIAAMISGRKLIPPNASDNDERAGTDGTFTSSLIALAVAAACGGAVWALVSL